MIAKLIHLPPGEATTGSADVIGTTLVTRAREGDEAAVSALYRKHFADVRRVARFVLDRMADVDDVVQDAFIHAFDRLDTLRDDTRFGPWLTRLTVNLARSRMRRQRVRRALWLDSAANDVAIEELACAKASPEQRAELAALGRALRELPAQQRIAWTLRHVEGYSLAEVSEALGVSLATAKRRLSSAQRRIAAYARDYVAAEKSR